MNEELKPCPFCGDVARLVWSGDGTGGMLAWVMCYACEGDGPEQAYEKAANEFGEPPEHIKRDARIAWNCRAADERVRELTRALSRKISDDCPPGYDAKGARCRENADCSTCWRDWYTAILQKHEKGGRE